MKQPHKHAELIKAWADGAEIEFRLVPGCGEWRTAKHLIWADDMEYRIKPETKPDVVFYYTIDEHGEVIRWNYSEGVPDLALTFDWYTRKLKLSRVIE